MTKTVRSRKNARSLPVVAGAFTEVCVVSVVMSVSLSKGEWRRPWAGAVTAWVSSTRSGLTAADEVGKNPVPG
ncbi:hypothetical protein GCM10017579_17950 [Nocardioides luteus]|uniref:Isochorismatase-like domain-containing protein n=1 Tax=Nocardioides luteus TaxID=1844 RepID=A0ABQ5SVA9_9ACTN|nr:hypothetical protein GCM10017579_17950 [Nocardioides luteus]